MTDTINPLSLTFMGSPDFAVPALKALINAGHKVKCVYTQPPRPAGRGQQERLCPVHVQAVASEIEVRTPTNFSNQADRAEFVALDVDAVIVAAYGLLLPNDLLSAPGFGCLNIHASLLPRWRGAAPIQRAILAGDATTGITIMAMEAKLDTGPIYTQEEVPIAAGTTAQSLHDQLAKLGGSMVVETLTSIVDGILTPIPQPARGITYAKKLKKYEGRIDWTQRSTDIDRQVRGLNPQPGVWFVHGGQQIKVLAARPDTGRGKMGTVIKAPLSVACREGSLCIERLQRPGKGPMEVNDYLRGNPIAVGTQLS